VTKNAEIDRVDAEIDEIAQRILLELESEVPRISQTFIMQEMMLRLADIHYAKKGTATDRKWCKASQWLRK